MIIIWGLLLSYSSIGQYDGGAQHDISFNMGSLLFQLVPFQSSSVKTGPFDLNYKYKRDNRAFVLGFGVTSTEFNVFAGSDTGYNLRIGYHKHTELSEKWSYYRGIDAIRSSRGFNRPIDSGSIYSTTGLGLPIGIQYHFNPYISVWTEGIFYLSVSSENIFGDFSPVQFLPPLTIHLSARL